jgi:hypothetical protein
MRRVVVCSSSAQAPRKARADTAARKVGPHASTGYSVEQARRGCGEEQRVAGRPALAGRNRWNRQEVPDGRLGFMSDLKVRPPRRRVAKEVANATRDPKPEN